MRSCSSSSWATPTSNRSGRISPPAKPISTAPSTIKGNGTCKTKIPTKAAIATASMSPLASAFVPMRIVAATTIAITAGARPEKIAFTHVTSPCTAKSQLRPNITNTLGSTNMIPATRPPFTRCRSHPR